jgi:hypothetical protein
MENEDEIRQEKERDLWRSLSGAARDTIHCLFKYGPTYDGNVPSKLGRDELLDKKLAVKMCMKMGEDGYQALSYLGNRVYRRGLELEKEKVK